MSNVPTPHISAIKGDFADTVLMPGDPCRATFIAENFFDNYRLVNDVRGIKGYTGYYKNKLVSVMASGMGMPSMGIYSYELFNFYNVQNIIRVGSAGSYNKGVKIRDIVIAQAACTDSSFAKHYNLPGNFSPIADYNLIEKTVKNASKLNIPFHVGNILSSDVFYGESDNTSSVNSVNLWSKMGVLAVEMESAALYMNAARSDKCAITICTISDSLITGETTTSSERQNSFTDMINLALETAISI